MVIVGGGGGLLIRAASCIRLTAEAQHICCERIKPLHHRSLLPIIPLDLKMILISETLPHGRTGLTRWHAVM